VTEERAGLDLEIVETVFGPVWTRRNDYVNAQLRKYGAHQRNELAMLLSFVREGDTVLDVGAHIGTFSLPIAARVGASGRVYAFEGCPDSHSILAKNVELHQKTSVVIPTLGVVTDQPGDYEIHMKGDWTSAAYFSRRPAGSETQAGEACVHLDSWWAAQQGGAAGSVQIMKIDTEGMELKVLRSAQNVIARNLPIIYAEISYDQLARQGDRISDIEAFLKRFGYHLFVNEGERNSTNDSFRIRRLWKLAHGGSFFDVLAVHPDSPRHPREYASGAGALVKWLSARASGVSGRLKRLSARLAGRR
jgi:FkbM family methyltransferase